MTENVAEVAELTENVTEGAGSCGSVEPKIGGRKMTGNAAKVAGSCRNGRKLTENVAEVTGSR